MCIRDSTKKDCHDLSINNAKLDSQCLHGDMQQEQRESTMRSFRDNKFSVLIATDVAARGLDLPMVDLVIQCAPPTDIDSFIHRAGRTGRAGRKGVASFSIRCARTTSSRRLSVTPRSSSRCFPPLPVMISSRLSPVMSLRTFPVSSAVPPTCSVIRLRPSSSMMPIQARSWPLPLPS
eukprot:TRINITY_DN5735_c0_g1_i1.p1 TRINITY_DN5735_c0_g1~~TRINITY_DN5735_c0_g1_i1.p1  ORF type:complete len:178 (+),score=30.06 TRINITY_DN5735_c0_g1_i1:94-627(+)